jgi:hypothetical protein
MKRMLVAFLVFSLPCAVFAKSQTSRLHKELQSATALENDRYSPFLINNVFNYYGNNGDGSYNKLSTDNEGFEFPKGGGKTTTFQDGIIWAGFHKGRAIPTMGGSVYRHGLQAGKILTRGTATTDPIPDNPTLAAYRVFRVRPDVRPSTAYNETLATLLSTDEVALTGRYESVTAKSLYDQYVLDWNEWPASDGAPYEDVNGNGIYEPAVDIPGVKGADQTLWYVANDLDSARVYNLSGSPPIGIELHKTIWGYRNHRALTNTIFISTKIINKSGAPVDSMFIGQWADPDLGDAGDDFVGCDTTLDLGYVYNGGNSDMAYGASVPAVGFVLLSGPTVPGTATDSAIVGLYIRRGVRALRVSSFPWLTSGHVEYEDPRQGAGGDAQWYCALHGLSTRSCSPIVDSTTGWPSPFYANGDPVRGSGWLDGQVYAYMPGDRRMLLSAGPFTFADGDTQEIVVAHLAARGTDRLSSVTLLKESATEIRDAYRNLPPWPLLEVHVSWPSRDTAQISIHVDGNPVHARSAGVIIKRKDGTTLKEVQLYDDGLHGDSTANDGVFSGTTDTPVELVPVSFDVRTADASSRTAMARGLVRDVTIAGNLVVAPPAIFSESYISDSAASPGENIRFGIHFTNETPFHLSVLRMIVEDAMAREFALVSGLDSGASWENIYDAGDPASYIFADVPYAPLTTDFTVPLLVLDNAGNQWIDTLRLPPATPQGGYLPIFDRAPRTAGWAHGTFRIAIVDRGSVRDHRYLIRSFSPDSAGGPTTITLEDSTDGRMLLNRHELPDSLGHNMPLTDGFKILKGGIVYPGGRMRSSYPSSDLKFWSSSGGSRTALDGYGGFNGKIGNAFEHWVSGGVPFERQKSIRILFSATSSEGTILNQNGAHASYAHRYLRNADQTPAQPAFAPFITNPGPGYAYQDYSTQVPFAAFDIDTIPQRRLMVGYLENNVPGGLVDGKYWPPIYSSPYPSNTDSTGPREWFFIFDLPYDGVPNPSLQVDIASERTPLMWFGVPLRYSYHSAPADGDSFTIATYLAPRTGDTWSFNPGLFLGGVDPEVPSSFECFQNYPNPFNAVTTIMYTLPGNASVGIRVYNILGQQVRLLTDGEAQQGHRTAVWDGKNDTGVPVSSGVYFYRLEVVTREANPHTFIHIGKMMMVK